MSTIYTSTPRAMMLGVRDESIREIPLEDIVLPSHLPWTMTFAEQGDGFPHMLMGAGAIRMFGAETFDITGRYATHQTAAINVFMQNANPMMIQRIIPADAKTAILRLSVEIISTMIPNYERNDDGSYVYEFNEFDERVPVVKEMIAGQRLVYHTSLAPWVENQEVIEPGVTDVGGGHTLRQFRSGTVTSHTGEKLGELTPEISTQPVYSDLYPIMDIEVSSAGAFGNARGIRLILPTTKGSSPIDLGSVLENQAYIPRVGLVRRDPIDGRDVNISTTSGDLFIDVCFKEGARTERGKVPLFIGDRLIEEYQIANVNQPYIPGSYGKTFVYQNELAELTQRIVRGTSNVEGNGPGLIRGEENFNPDAPWRPYELTDLNSHLLNFLGGYDETGAPYFSFETKKSALFGGVAIGNETYIFPSGGDDGLPLLHDGSVDELAKYEIFDNEVRRATEEFGQGEVKWLNTAKYPINAIWDTGFSIETKKAMLTPIGLRKDVAVVLATHSVGDYTTKPDEEQMRSMAGRRSFSKQYGWVGDNDMATETSVAGMLRTHASLFPESEVHGTPVCRAIIVGQSGRLINSPYTRRLPLTIEYANKVSRFMGSADGFWNPTRAYDQKGQNIIELMRDINLTWREENVANQQWANGLVYAEDYDMRRMFFPAIRTVYNNETSVLNSSITMWAITTIEREAHNSWRDLVGNAKFSPAKFLQESDRILTERLAKRFDDRFIIEVETFYTKADVLRGYSWSCNIHIYAPNMKTVGQYTVVAHRIEDYQADLAA